MRWAVGWSLVKGEKMRRYYDKAASSSTSSSCRVRGVCRAQLIEYYTLVRAAFDFNGELLRDDAIFLPKNATHQFTCFKEFSLLSTACPMFHFGANIPSNVNHATDDGKDDDCDDGCDLCCSLFDTKWRGCLAYA